jgi:hypothetical protein
MPRPADARIKPTPLADRPEVRRLTRIFADRPLTLSAYHAAGEQLRRLQDDPAISHRGSGWRAAVAELVGQSEATLNKCLQFRRSYEPEDVPWLEQLGVGWSRVTVALAVPDKKKRQQLLSRACKDGWDDQGLQREIQRLRGSRRGGGRPRKRPRSHGLLADLGELVRLTDFWIDFHDTVFAGGRQAYMAEIEKMSHEARDSVGEHVVHAVEKLQRLQERSEKALMVLRAVKKRVGNVRQH